VPPPSVHLQVTTPSPWVTRFARLLRPGSSVLDVACGGGRHTRFLLQRGCKVTAVDKDTSPVADLADKAEVVEADLEDGSPWPFAGRTFDAVVVTNYLHRPLFPALAEAVAPEGVLLYETFAIGNEQFARPRNPDHLLKPGELLRAFSGLQVIAYEAGRQERFDGPRVIERIACVRSSAPALLP